MEWAIWTRWIYIADGKIRVDHAVVSKKRFPLNYEVLHLASKLIRNNMWLRISATETSRVSISKMSPPFSHKAPEQPKHTDVPQQHWASVACLHLVIAKTPPSTEHRCSGSHGFVLACVYLPFVGALPQHNITESGLTFESFVWLSAGVCTSFSSRESYCSLAKDTICV